MYYILAILSGLLTAVSFPTVFGSVKFPNFGFLAWFSLVPLFYSIKGASPRKGFLLSFISFAVCYSVSLYWLYTALNTYGHLPSHISVAVLILLIVILAVYISLAPMLSLMVEQRLGIDTFWTLPVFWVVCEFARNYIPCNGFPWGNITNSQYAYLNVIQVTDIIGVYGLAFMMIAVNLAIEHVIAPARPCTRWCRARLPFSGKSAATPKIIFAIALVIFVLVYGHFRIKYFDSYQKNWPSLRIALLQGNIPQDEKWQAEFEDEQLAVYKKFIGTLKGGNVKLTVIPEASFPRPIPLSETEIDPEVLGLSADSKNGEQYLLMGALSVEKPANAKRRLYNSMVLVDKNGDLLGRYHKAHLVPFGEYVPYKKLLFFAKKLVAPVGDFAAGSAIEPLFTDNFQIGGLICYEDLFPEIAREQVLKGANFLTVITNDAWYGRSSAAFQHLAISVFRAVENRRWMIKSANSGVSAVVDPVGRIISSTDIFQEGMIVSNVRLGEGFSIYTKYGDFFAWACVGIFVLLIGIIFSGLLRRP